MIKMRLDDNTFLIGNVLLRFAFGMVGDRYYFKVLSNPKVCVYDTSMSEWTLITEIEVSPDFDLLKFCNDFWSLMTVSDLVDIRRILKNIGG